MNRWQAGLVLLLAPLLVVGGCKRCTTEDPPAPPPPKQEGDLGMVDTPDEADVDRPYLEALQTLKVDPLASTGGERPPLRYQPPPCRLVYEVRNAAFSEVAEGRQASGVVTVTELEATAQPGDRDVADWAIRVLSAATAVHADGEAAAREVDLSIWSPITLRTERRNLRELKGPSTLWAAHSVTPALATIFFPLPARAEPGAALGWKQRVFHRRETAEAERRRLAGKPVHPKAPKETMAHLQLDEWVTMDGTPVAELRGQWGFAEREVEPLLARRVERWRVRGAFSSQGWPLLYVAVANVWRFVAPSEGEGHETLGGMMRSLRLVEACEGPVLKRFPGPESPQGARLPQGAAGVAPEAEAAAPAGTVAP